VLLQSGTFGPKRGPNRTISTNSLELKGEA
jgi:hypothetical protein